MSAEQLKKELEDYQRAQRRIGNLQKVLDSESASIIGVTVHWAENALDTSHLDASDIIFPHKEEIIKYLREGIESRVSELKGKVSEFESRITQIPENWQ